MILWELCPESADLLRLMVARGHNAECSPLPSSLGAPMPRLALSIAVSCIPLCIAQFAIADETPNPPRHQGPSCFVVDPYFANEVWAKVGETTCFKCHRVDGEASDSNFLLQATDDLARRREVLGQNQVAFERMAASIDNEQSRLLVKAAGGMDHGGGAVLTKDASHYAILSRFVTRLQHRSPDPSDLADIDASATQFFEGIKMLPDARLLRRVTLSLAARLPTQEEQDAVASNGLCAVDTILDQLMTEPAFYDRLQEAFNDIFLLHGTGDVPESVLSYDHFNETRFWPRDYDFGSDLTEEEQKQARYKLFDTYREAIQREPYELIKYIVKNNRPFTELVTADYIMVSPYTARGYGVFDSLKEEFENPDDPFEYIPTQIPALTSRSGKVQETDDGHYPHAGLLSTFHYTRRYPTTETNRNRLRARMYYQHFLGLDIMQLAPRVSDAAAVDAKYDVPTMQAAECVVCHKTLDPVAGLFQDYDKDGWFISRRADWHADMFRPGREDESRPDNQRWRSLQWLGERTAADPRFAPAMVEHVYYILMGRKVLPMPQDIDDPLFKARRRAYVAQRDMIASVAKAFVDDNYNLKTAFKEIIHTEFYRADTFSSEQLSPDRLAELDDLGLSRLLSPEQLERKIVAVFGRPWGRLKRDYTKIDILYGGIDSAEVTERMADPSGAMGAIQNMMAHEVACKNVALDFTTEPCNRLLFPHIEPNVTPREPANEPTIRAAIVHLHRRVLGLDHELDDPDVDRTYQLFKGIVDDAHNGDGFEQRDIYACRGHDDQRLDDPEYTIRAWRAVLAYLLLQHEFLYE